MRIIAGLGNPGKKYEGTRHNIGFMYLDFLRQKLGQEDFHDSRFGGLISEGGIDKEKVILIKPLTYMNLSGECVKSITDFYKLNHKKDFIVIFDDASMDFGKVRYRDAGSAGGHNGIKSIIDNFGGEEFKRVKIGIGYDEKFLLEDWVLSKFGKEEKAKLNDIFEKVII